MLNLGSLVLGLIAWIVPIVILIRHKNIKHHLWVAFSMISISACAMSLCFQIFSIHYIVKLEDWASLLDIMATLTLASSVLLIVTIVLNTITFIVCRNRTIRLSEIDI